MNYQAEMSDEKLIRFYLNSNPAAMSTLVELYKDRIYSSIFSMVQDKYATEEIYRQVFEIAVNDIIAGKRPENEDFLQWAINISHHLCINYTCKNVQQSEAVFITHSLPTTTFFDSHNKIKYMISRLPEQQREVIALNHYAGLSFKEIAGIMKCSLSTALDLMLVGLNNLRKQMAESKMAA